MTILNRFKDLMSEIIWDLALIQKYNQSGPRYTSYPTALEFNENYNFKLRFYWQLYNRYPEMSACPLYVHIRFVTNVVTFVAVIKVITRHQHKADIYLDYLEKKSRARSELFQNRVATQIHWGGGTPNLFDRKPISSFNGNVKRSFYNIG